MKGKYLLLSLLICSGCLTTIDPQSIDFEDLLVVDARITDEFGFQEIHLSRTVPVNSDSTRAETGAEVYLEFQNSRIDFFEEEPGIYLSESPFAAQANADYQLFIDTQRGESLESSAENMIPTPPVSDLYGEFTPFTITNNEGSGTFNFFFDSENEVNDSRFYLIEWSETFLLRIPFPSSFQWVGGNEIIPRGPGDSVEFCYRTREIPDILVHESQLESSRIVRFPVRTFDSFENSVALRYSFEVTQYSLSQEAFTYWRQISDDSEDEGILIQAQPGSFPGNITDITNRDNTVLGRFDVLSKQTRRIFARPSDFREDGFRITSTLFTDCNADDAFRTPLEEVGEFLSVNTSFGIWFLESGLNDNPIDGPNVPEVVYLPRECTDCTVFGSNVRPDFWID